MGHVDVANVRYELPDGRVLLDDVSFRVGDGVRAALVGENGAGKTTLLRIVAGDLVPESGTVARGGGLGVMRQFIGSVRDDTTVQRFLVVLSPPAVREAWDAVEAAELALMETDDEPAQLAYAAALAHWGDVRGYRMWSRRDKGRPLRVVIQAELFPQVHASGLPATQRQFAELARLYGIATHEEGRIAGHDVEEQALVGLG